MASDYGDQAKYEENPYNINFGKAITASGVRTALGTKEDVANKQDTLANSSTEYPSSKAVYAHTSRVDNPHGVTKAQVGLGSANDTSDMNKPVSTATQTALSFKQDASGRVSAFTGNVSDDTKYPSAKLVYAHTSAANNPHGVTKAQVGLGNVNNTSDLDKPVLAATQTALNNKQNKITWVQSISVSSTHSQYPTAKAVWDFVQASKPRLRVSTSLTSTRTTWYDAVRKCIEETHAAADVPYSVKADMTANGYTASATEANCISYQDMYAPGRHKIYRLLTAAEWMEFRTKNTLSYGSTFFEWVGDAHDSDNRVIMYWRYDIHPYLYEDPTIHYMYGAYVNPGNAIGFRLSRIA
ncbi:phage tail fiber protein [Candidatus Termititenax persephonae]|uniref:Phage tail fiber protein n=1 Tax=Candidatus Termititenax persephonae TaxID=2218525 RepID=A0A388TKX9_9BACT|nr:phage tail fiber protein [Candidatus Termititenax persephonae]